MKKCLFCYQTVENETEGEYHARCSRKFFGRNRPPLLELSAEALANLARQTFNQRIAVTGAQPKLSANIAGTGAQTRITVVGLWGNYILKPQHDHFPFMPETEDLTLKIAAAFKISVCKHTLLRATDGSLAYLTQRFDRDKERKIHVEDLCQLSERLSEDKYKGSYERIGKVILKHSAAPGLDALAFFEMVVFSYLTGNSDMHLKNFSLLHTPAGPRLSPAYDLLSVRLVYPQDKEELALTLNGKKKNLKRWDFNRLAESLHIPEKARDNIYQKFIKNRAVAETLIRSSFLPVDWQERYSEIWNLKIKTLVLTVSN